MSITIATCQFPVFADVSSNLDHILQLMSSARSQGATVAHFCEASLSGYAGIDFAGFDGFDWTLLKEATLEVMKQAQALGLWVVVGSAHRLSETNKPHNCSYIIDNTGTLIDRYDKLFCAGDATGTTGDLAHYTSGDHFSVFEMAGVRCGALICHDYRYPELYREYKRHGVQVMFHSYHAGGISDQRYQGMTDYVGTGNSPLTMGSTLPALTMPAGMIAAASNNYMWISCPNSSAQISCVPAYFVRPDGVITGSLDLHETGVLLSMVDTDQEYYDSTVAWRDRSIQGIYHSGDLIDDTRSKSRTTL
ncbi:MAG TPA: carbon-nitrogen hydrolase family protein [Phototrophicaceae bacterium]|jgi:predicted amidohydrolase|nr:carbon-nitrogen hydrolase family protein [Phototrophicaceae bacterium]